MRAVLRAAPPSQAGSMPIYFTRESAYGGGPAHNDTPGARRCEPEVTSTITQQAAPCCGDPASPRNLQFVGEVAGDEAAVAVGGYVGQLTYWV